MELLRLPPARRQRTPDNQPTDNIVQIGG